MRSGIRDRGVYSSYLDAHGLESAAEPDPGAIEKKEDLVCSISQVRAEVYRDGDVAIYENLHAYPRAFVVPEAVVAPDGTNALAQLSDGPIDPLRGVLTFLLRKKEPPCGGSAIPDLNSRCA